MLEIIIINVHDECGPVPKTHKKVKIDVNYKFQEIWTVKMPWAKLNFNEVGVVSIVRCDNVCTKIERKKEIFVAKWDFIDKHVGIRKGSNGKWIMDPKSMHVKNEISYVQLFTTVLQQLSNGQAMEDKQKLV
jgi:hypothetical protein